MLGKSVCDHGQLPFCEPGHQDVPQGKTAVRNVPRDQLSPIGHRAAFKLKGQRILVVKQPRRSFRS